LVTIRQTKRHHIPENNNLHLPVNVVYRNNHCLLQGSFTYSLMELNPS
jgi:hypothetical protein